MSTLQVSNLHLESTGNNRIQYLGSNQFSFSAGGATVATVNTTSFYTNLNFDIAGTFRVNNTDINPIGQQTIWVPAVAMYPRLTNGPAYGTIETTTNRVILRTIDFDTTTQEFAQFAIQMPKGWNEGTLIFQFLWSHAATTTNFGVVWAIEAVGFRDNDATDVVFGTAVQVADVGGTTNNIYITNETAALTVAGVPTPEEYIIFQVKRVPADASDTMAIDARLHGVKIHYTIDAARDD